MSRDMGGDRFRPATDQANQLAFEKAVGLAAQLHYGEAIGKFSSLIDTFEKAGKRPRAAEAMFWQAYCHEKLGQSAQARELYDSVTTRYPGTPASRQAAGRLSRIVTEPK